MPKLEPYSRRLDYSYALGVFPCLNLLEARPESVRRLLLHPDGLRNEGVSLLREKCQALGVREEFADRVLRRESQKDNCFAALVFEKYEAALNPDRPHVVLCQISDGGNLAIKFALTDPQAVDRLILNGANVDMLAVVPWAQLPLYPTVGLLSLGAPFSPALAQKRDVLALMTRDYGVTLSDLARIDAPALVLAGDRDMIRPSHTRAIAQALPHAVLAIQPGSHVLAGESPARFCLNCLRFLRGEPVPDRKTDEYA